LAEIQLIFGSSRFLAKDQITPPKQTQKEEETAELDTQQAQ
jgi:hypothetical protein